METIGAPFRCEEHDAVALLADLRTPLVMCVNDPPSSTLLPRLRQAGVPVTAVVHAHDMERRHLDDVVRSLPPVAEGATVVGFGGGTALDTAKYVAWQRRTPLVQIPTITSVDASFTDAVGVREAGRVRYVGTVEPQLVVVDLPLIRVAAHARHRVRGFCR